MCQDDGGGVNDFDGDVAELGDEDIRKEEAAENIEMQRFQT